MNSEDRPELDQRARGWLRFIWDKATTADDWSVAGEPRAWWDRYSTPPMCSLGRFDLHETGYVLPVMCDITPAWREVYARIADELVSRHTSFWAAIDWLTMIGHDPDQQRYPPEWLAVLPEHLRGHYDAPGWVANGVSPWGLQPDPVGADGNNFFRGFFNLLLCFYRYVCDDGKWEKPFRIAGYQDRLFEWDHHSIVNFMHDQWSERPQGVHCENTKIWPFCVSGAGLGLQLYDGLYGARTDWVYERWLEYAKQHFMGVDSRGNLDWFAFYYDPLERSMCTLRDDVGAYAAIAITLYIMPRDRDFATRLYEMALHKLGWGSPSSPLLQLHPDPRWLTLGLITARELGDDQTEKRLRQAAEAQFEPKFFGPEGDHFGWWFHFNEDWPRGQLSSLMVLSELGTPGSWSRVFQQPDLGKFSAPTVSGVDFPRLGLSRCLNDPEDGVLWIETYCATRSARGSDTAFKITGLPDPGSVKVFLNNEEYTDWQADGRDSITLKLSVTEQRFRVHTGHAQTPRETPEAGERRNAPSSSGTPSVTLNAETLHSAQQTLAGGGCSAGCC